MNNQYEIFDSKWYIQIILACDQDICKFNQLHNHLNISRTQLTRKLKILNKIGIIEKRSYFDGYYKFSYHLTEKGKTLLYYFGKIIIFLNE